MDIWNFADYRFVIFFTIMVVLLALTGLVISSFVISRKKEYTIEKNIKKEANTIVVYVVDFKNSSVLFFNRSAIHVKNKITLSQFYLRFNSTDIEKLKEWLYAICVENRSVDDFIEVDMVTSKSKNHYYSLLRKIKYDQATGYLHLESHLMKYTSPNNVAVHKARGIESGHVTQETMKELVEKQKSLSGYTFCIRFFYIRNQIVNDDKIDKVIAASLKNVVYRFCVKSKTPRQIIDETNSEIILFDLTINDKEKAMKLLANVSHELRKKISIGGYNDTVGFAIGVVDNAQYYQDYSTMIRTSQQACIYAQQHDLSSYFYTRSNKLILSETGKYSQEITRLLKPGILKYTFRAIVDAASGNTIGFFNYVNEPISPFKNFMEMSKYSAKVHRNKEFFAFVCKNIMATYSSEKLNNNDSLFMHVSLSDVDFLYEIISTQLQINKCPLVLVFSERDFDEEESGSTSIYELVGKLRKHNVKFALDMHDQNLLLEPQIYTNFDYFIVGSSMVKEIRKSKSIRLSIHTLVEQLLKYKKPIIATDMEGWQSIELIVNSGITLLSSETIAPSNAMIRPLDKKIVEKLKSIASK